MSPFQALTIADVGDEAALHHVGLAVELAHLLALGDQRADAGLGEEGRDAGAAGADALGQRALRVELELELAGEVLLRELLVLADIGRDHLPDLARSQQHAEARAVDAALLETTVRSLTPLADRGDQVLRDAAQAEAAGHDRHAVEEPASAARASLYTLSIVPPSSRLHVKQYPCTCRLLRSAYCSTAIPSGAMKSPLIQ